MCCEFTLFFANMKANSKKIPTFAIRFEENRYKTIKSKFIAYQSPLNRVKNFSFISAVDELVRLHSEQPNEFEKESMDLISMVSHATNGSRNQYLEQIKVALQNLDNHKFEDLIGELFKWHCSTWNMISSSTVMTTK